MLLHHEPHQSHRVALQVTFGLLIMVSALILLVALTPRAEAAPTVLDGPLWLTGMRFRQFLFEKTYETVARRRANVVMLALSASETGPPPPTAAAASTMP